MADQLRIVELDAGSIQVWIWSEGPLHRGWYFREFPKGADARETVNSWLTSALSIKGWDQRTPPDVAELENLKLDIEVIRHDEANANYWAGQDEGAAGVSGRWEEALTKPIPKAGVMREPLECLYRRTEALRSRAERLAAATGLPWSKTPPTPADLNGRSEEYFWIRGGNFNRPLLVRANNGTNSELVDGQRVYRPEVNFQFFADGYPETIWSSELKNWPWLLTLEWAGPVERAVNDQPTEK